MQIVQKVLVSLLVWGSLFTGSVAQTLVQDPSGFQLQVPAGYEVRQDAGGTVCSDGTNIVVIKSHGYSSFDDFAREANLAQDGFTLVGEVQSLNSADRHFRASRPDPQGGYLIADTFVRFSPYGGGATVVALSNSQTAEAGFYAGQTLCHQVQFSRPAAGNAWEQALAGKHLLYLYTGNGYSERYDLYLFGNKTFSTRSDMSSVSMNGSGAVAGGGEGTWSITPAGQLVLRFYSGNSQTYQLAPRQASNEVSLNGKRFFVMSE